MFGNTAYTCMCICMYMQASTCTCTCMCASWMASSIWIINRSWYLPSRNLEEIWLIWANIPGRGCNPYLIPYSTLCWCVFTIKINYTIFKFNFSITSTNLILAPTHRCNADIVRFLCGAVSLISEHLHVYTCTCTLLLWMLNVHVHVHAHLYIWTCCMGIWACACMYM